MRVSTQLKELKFLVELEKGIAGEVKQHSSNNIQIADRVNML